MDSKQLYAAAEHLSSTVTWDMDWIHFGTKKEIKKDLIEDLIKDFLADEVLYFVHGRKDSREYKRAEFPHEIEQFLGQENFQLWNHLLTKVIQFDKIGVLRMGKA
jgi:hypothetical protein